MFFLKKNKLTKKHQKLSKYKYPFFFKISKLIVTIDYLFLSNIKSIYDFEITRLVNHQAQNYYENYILISQQNSLEENIINLVN